MKYCRYCGSEMMDEAVVCVKCGCPVNQTTATVEVANNKLPPVVLVGFIMSMVSAFLSVLLFTGVEELYFLGIPFAVAGLVCSIIGLVKVKRNGLRGKGFAIAGLVVGAVFTAMWLILILIAFYFVILIYLFIILLFAAMV